MRPHSARPHSALPHLLLPHPALALVALALVLAGGSAHAANAVGRTIEFQDPSSPNYVEPRLPARDAGHLDAPLPAIDDLPPPRPGTGHGFRVHTIDVRACTALAPAELDALTEPYLDRLIAAEDVDALRLSINRAYLERGYINSGVVVPAQDVSAGTLVLEAIEGTLTDVTFEGGMHLDERYVETRVARHVHAPLNLGDLQTALYHLQRDPNIDRVDAHLVPGERLGESALRLALHETERFELGLGADNHRSPSVGETRGRLSAVARNLTGWGEVTRVSYTLADEGDEAAGSFGVPIGSRGTSVEAYGARSDARIVEKNFENLDIESLTTTWGALVSHKLIDDLDNTVTLSIGLEAKESETELLGLPFSFSPGAVDGVSKTWPLLAGLDWLRRGPDHVLGLRGTYRRGLDIRDATIFAPRTPFEALLNPTGADGEFELLLLQGIYIHRLNQLPGFGWAHERGQVIARGTAQDAFDPLMSLEKIAIGGVATVRGYRENLLVRDNGFAMTLELQIPLPGYQAEAHWRNLLVAPFIDYGRSWDEKNTDQTSPTRDTTKRRWILGAGIGLLWEPIDGLLAQVYWGEDAGDNFEGDDPRDTDADDGLQGDGIHYSVTWSMRF